jgi:hypothetical protein
MSHSSGGYGENLAQGYRDPVTAIQVCDACVGVCMHILIKLSDCVFHCAST